MTDEASKERRGRSPVARGLRIAGFVVIGVVGAALFALAFGYFVKLLWNWLMPAIFGLGTITYWQAFGIVILAKLVFGGIGGGHRPERRPGRWNRHGTAPWGREWHGDWRGFWDEVGRDAFRGYVERKRAEKGEQEPPEKAPSDA